MPARAIDEFPSATNVEVAIIDAARPTVGASSAMLIAAAIVTIETVAEAAAARRAAIHVTLSVVGRSPAIDVKTSMANDVASTYWPRLKISFSGVTWRVIVRTTAEPTT